MTQPVIAAVATLLPQSETPKRPAGHVAMSVRYVEALQRAGGRVVILPAIEGTPRTPPSELLEGADGLCLIGGGDLDPSTYGEGAHDMAYGFNEPRDEMELELARHALETELPLLGICRGCQVVNVACGGTLHQHIEDIEGIDGESHGRPHLLLIGRHPVTAVVGSRIAAAIGGPVATSCASAHHQSAKRVGRGLEVTATSPDGCIEALESPGDHGFALAVQWHPEITAGEDPQQQGIFDAFVAAARDERARRTSELAVEGRPPLSLVQTAAVSE